MEEKFCCGCCSSKAASMAICVVEMVVLTLALLLNMYGKENEHMNESNSEIYVPHTSRSLLYESRFLPYESGFLPYESRSLPYESRSLPYGLWPPTVELWEMLYSPYVTGCRAILCIMALHGILKDKYIFVGCGVFVVAFEACGNIIAFIVVTRFIYTFHEISTLPGSSQDDTTISPFYFIAPVIAILFAFTVYCTYVVYRHCTYMKKLTEISTYQEYYQMGEPYAIRVNL